MKTTELIDLLSRQAGPAPNGVSARAFAPVMILGAVLGLVLALTQFGALPSEIWGTPTPWMKLIYGGALAAAAVWLSTKLARPVARMRASVTTVLMVLAAMFALGLAWWLSTPSDGREAALFGHSWTLCPRRVFWLALPTLFGMLWVMRGLAPTRPRAAGFAAGLTAGAVGVCIYAVACGETSPTFVAAWYTVGALAVAVLGALLGPRVLRW